MGKDAFKQRIVIGILCLFVLSYTLYHIGSLFGEEISTVAAGVVTESDSISGHGYIFRDETVLRSSLGGVVDYLCEDGTKVSGGQQLATIYDKGSTADRQSIEQLDHQIAVLEESMDKTLDQADYADQRNDVNDQYYVLTRMLASGQTGELSLQIDNLLVGMNRLLVMESEQETSAVEETLLTLQAEKQAVLDKSGESVTETLKEGERGYFYADVDGYESLFTQEAFDSLSAESFFDLLSSQPEMQKDKNSAPYGKLAKNSQWGFVMEIPFDQLEFFEAGQTYRVEFVENYGVTLPMTLEKTIGVAARSSVLLCMRCDRLPENFDFHRTQSVRMETSRVSGLYVPEKALTYDEQDMTGVYILRGNVVHFRYVEIVYRGSDYYLVAESPTEQEKDYLAANDLIILGGQNLFDGRILE